MSLIYNMKKCFMFFIALALVFPLTVNAQEVSKQEVKLLVGFSAGDTLDVLTRILAAEVNKSSPFQVVVENAPGAGGVNAVAQVAQHKGKGIVLGTAVSNAFLLMPHKNPVPYKPLADLTPIVIFGQASPIIVTLPTSPYSTFEDLKKAADIRFALSGLGTPTHIALEEAAKKDSLPWKYIPFTGAGEVETALMGKHAEAGATAALSRVQEGQFRALAVLGSERLAALPNVPTFLELGYSTAGLADTYFMLFAPASLDKETLKAVEKAFSEAFSSEAYQKALKMYSVSPVFFDSAQSKAFLEKAWEEESVLLKSLGIAEKPATQPK